MTEDSYLGNLADPLTLNRYSYVKASPLNYVDPSGHESYWIDGRWVEASLSMPSNAIKPRNWGSWSDAISNNMIQGAQRSQLARAMEDAEHAAHTQVCLDVAEIAQSTFDFITSFILGAVTATVENTVGWYVTLSHSGTILAGEKLVTLTDAIEDVVSNKLAFYIGKLVADIGGMIGGISLAFLGAGGNAGGLALAPATVGTSIALSAAGAAITLEGVAITVSAANDIAISAKGIAAEISKSPSSSGTNDDSGDEEKIDSKLVKAADDISQKAKNGSLKRGKNYHGRLGEELEKEILSNPDAVYVTNNNKQNLVFRKGDNVVIVESKGSSKGNIITSYGPGGPRGESGAAIFGGSPSEPGMPATHEDIINGIMQPGGGTFPPATQIR